MKKRFSVRFHGALMRLLPLLFLALLFPPALSAADLPVKRVLILFPYSPEYPSWDKYLSGLRVGFSGEKEYRLELYYELFDGERFSRNADYLRITADYYRLKYLQAPPDLIVAGMMPGETVDLFSSLSFPGIPMLWASNLFNDDVPGNPRNLYSLRGPYDFGKTFDLIRQLSPEVKRLLVVIGTSPREKNAVAELRKMVPFWDEYFDFEFLDALTYPEILDRAHAAPKDSAVVFFWLFRDINGNAHVPADVAKALSVTSAAPVFGIQRAYVGAGIVGGYVWDVETWGKNVAIAALEILHGAGRVPAWERKIDAGSFTVDWAALNRWSIEPSRLPPDAVIVNRPRSGFEWYGPYVLVSALLVVSNAISVVILLFYRGSKRKTERELDVVNVRLSLSLKEGAELNRRLDSRALRDPLTGLFNRKHVSERIGDEFLRFERTRSEFSIIQVDVDSFQTVNQRFGNETGNILLSRIAGELTKLVRLYDVLGRWSGAEFMVLLPDTDEQSATGFAERIRKAVSGAVYFEHEHKLVVTISCGIASSGTAPTVAELTRNAGLALAEAQRRGRNRVIRYSSLGEN